MHIMDFREVGAGFQAVVRLLQYIEVRIFVFTFKAPSSLMETLEQHLNSLEGKKPGNK